MTRFRLMQAWSVLLWVSLILGGYEAIRERQYVPAAVGIGVNLALQYALCQSIRREQRLHETGEQTSIRQDDETSRLIFQVALPVIAGMAISVGLLVAGIVTASVWPFIVLGVALIGFIFLTRSLQRVQREQRK